MNGFIKKSKFRTIFVLIISGEMIFSLPFHLTRYFRPTILEAFNLTNANIGDAFAVYGLTAMICYLPGGVIADKFSLRLLLSLSLFATSIGGFFLLMITNVMQLTVLYGYWGITSILFFWAALIKATRIWGGEFAQGRAFGFLDGGRGLVAAGFATLGVTLFAFFLPEQGDLINNYQREIALKIVIIYYTSITFLTGILVWLFLPKNEKHSPPSNKIFSVKLSKINTKDIKNVLLISIIIACAYSGYKSLDNFTLYMTQVLNWHEAKASAFLAFSTYLRPIAAISAGFLSDKFNSQKIIILLFFLLSLSLLPLILLPPDEIYIFLIFSSIFLTFFSVFALRGIYFALINDSKLSIKNTGLIVGIVSMIGYTPDIFFAPVGGRILDNSPGLIGHQNYFLLLFFISIIGIFCSIILLKTKKRILEQQD